MIQDRYLLCKIGLYTIAVRIEAVQHIGEIEAISAAHRVDLRALLKIPQAESGIAVALRIAEIDVSLIVDGVAHIETIADSEFIPLPPVFDEANALFDGGCRRPISGQHPLRLRLQPLAAAAVAASNPL